MSTWLESVYIDEALVPMDDVDVIKAISYNLKDSNEATPIIKRTPLRSQVAT